MLVLSRKAGQEIRIGDSITISVVRSCGKRVRIGVTAPKEVRIKRAECLTDDEVEVPRSKKALAHD